MKLVITFMIYNIIALAVETQRIYHPTCSKTGLKTFNYIYVNPKLEWVGLGWLWTTYADRLHNVTIDVDFATAKLPNSTYLGSLKIISFHRVKSFENRNEWYLVFEVLFPIQNPLPDVTKLVFNDETLCDDLEKEFTTKKPELVKLHLEYNDFTKEQSFTSEHIISFPGINNSLSQSNDDNENIGCGKIDKKNLFIPLILGGTTIQRGSWPWLVSVYSYSDIKLGFRCGATLISRKLIVTAAHCFFDMHNQQVKIEDVLVILGQYNLKRPQDTGSEILYPESVNIHPDYRKRNSIDSDIAVVVLADDVRFTTYVRPACLWNYSDSKDNIVGEIGLTAGWGRDENGNFYTELPKQTELPVVSDETCINSHGIFSKLISEVSFCAGWHNGTEGPCNGDSGGPLVFQREGRWTLRGVVSTALYIDKTNICDLNEYVVFTDVAKFRNWIMSFSDEMGL